jgi:hypothetical protein
VQRSEKDVEINAITAAKINPAITHIEKTVSLNPSRRIQINIHASNDLIYVDQMEGFAFHNALAKCFCISIMTMKIISA